MTKKEVRALFNYDSRGFLSWKKTGVATRKKPGEPIGWVCGQRGYVVTQFEGKRYFVHRLIWVYHYGKTKKMVDHINRIRTDNRIENIRTACPTLNAQNSSERKRTLPRGVTKDTNGNRFFARITVDKKQMYLGRFDCPKEASKIYKKARNKFFKLGGSPLTL